MPRPSQPVPVWLGGRKPRRDPARRAHRRRLDAVPVHARAVRAQHGGDRRGVRGLRPRRRRGRRRACCRSPSWATTATGAGASAGERLSSVYGMDMRAAAERYVLAGTPGEVAERIVGLRRGRRPPPHPLAAHRRRRRAPGDARADRARGDRRPVAVDRWGWSTPHRPPWVCAEVQGRAAAAMVEWPAMLELSEFAIGLATGPNPAYLATVNADGAPQVTPIWIDYEDGHLLVDAALGTLKLRNVQRDPRVAISIAEDGNLYTKVDIRGEVVGYIEGERAIAQMDLLAQRYLGMDKNPWAVAGSGARDHEDRACPGRRRPCTTPRPGRDRRMMTLEKLESETEAEREDLIALVRRFVDQEVRRALPRFERNDEYPQPLLDKMAELGFYGILIPEEYGGLGLSFRTFAEIQIELSRGWMSLSGTLTSHFTSRRDDHVVRDAGAAQRAAAADGAWRAEAVVLDDRAERGVGCTGDPDPRGARRRRLRDHRREDVGHARAPRQRGHAARRHGPGGDAAPPRHDRVRVREAGRRHGDAGADDPDAAAQARLQGRGVGGARVRRLQDAGVDRPRRSPTASAWGSSSSCRGSRSVGSASRPARPGSRPRRSGRRIRYAQEREAFGRPIAQHQAIQLNLAQRRPGCTRRG